MTARCERSAPAPAQWSAAASRWWRWTGPDVTPPRVRLVAVLLLLLSWSAVGNPQAPRVPRKPRLPGTISSRTPADLVLLNTRIYTAATPARAEAMAVLHGRIVAIGSQSTVLPYIGAHTVVWDLPGRAILPGLIDSHGHMAGLGEKL